MPYFPYNRYPYSNLHNLNLDWILDTMQELYRLIISYQGSATPYESDPRMDGVADPGTVDQYARGDHRHPTDTSRMGKVEYYNNYGSTMVPYMDGAGSSGSSYKWAHEDHQHPSDSNKFDKSGGRIYGPVSVDGEITVENDMTVKGVINITNRRAAAPNLSAGWHRVLQYAPSIVTHRLGRTGIIIAFDITRDGAANETHHISLSLVDGHVKFYGEESNSREKYINAIRYTYDDTNAYVDIQLSTAASDNVAVNYQVAASAKSFLSQITTKSLVAIANSPSGETVLTEYTFSANTVGAETLYVSANRGTIISGEAVHVGRMIHLNFVFEASDTATNSPQIASAPDALYDTALSAIDITNGMSTAIAESIPCGIGTSGKIFLQSITNGHKYAITGDYLI